MNILKYVRSNIGTIIILSFFLLITFSPKVKSIVMSGLVKTGLFNPNLSDVKNNADDNISSGKTLPLVSSVRFTSSSREGIDLANLKGKVIFLNFWATWCPPCIAEMPSVNSLYMKLKNNRNVIFILVDADGNLDKSAAFMKKKNYVLPVYIPASPIPKELFRGSLPTTVIVNRKGEIVYFNEGMANYDTPEMEEFLNDLSK